MRINITAWCRYKEYYSLDITEDYLKGLNEWFKQKYPDLVETVGSITVEDIHAVFDGEWNDRLDIQLDESYKLGYFIEDCVRADTWESYDDNEYWDMDEHEISVEYESPAERKALCGDDDTE